MVQNTAFQHISEIVEFLRGKTIIDAITIKREQGGQETVRLSFSFLDYVSWSYSERIKDSLRDEKELGEIEVTARQLFKEEGKNFTIGFKPQSVYFDGVSNIEDTLLLDLKRYLEVNAISYGVNTNGAH